MSGHHVGRTPRAGHLGAPRGNFHGASTHARALAWPPTRTPRERSAHLAAAKTGRGRSIHRPFAPECSPFVSPSSLLLAALLACCLGVAGPASPAARDRAADCEALKKTLLDLAQRAPFRDARLGVQLISLDDGSVVFSKDADELMNPASNVKLVTAAAALARLGPEYRFDTEFLVEPGPGGDQRPHPLGARQGRPELTTERLHAMASELAHLGLREVGDLVLDDT